MYCKICGKETDKGSRFCEYCGTQITVKPRKWTMYHVKGFVLKHLKKIIAIVLAIALIASAAAIIVNYNSPKAIVERVAKAELEGDFSNYDKYGVFNLISLAVKNNYYDEELIFEELSEDSPWEIDSWDDFYEVINTIVKESLEDQFGEYKTKVEATKVEKKSIKSFISSNADTIFDSESVKLFDVDDVSDVRLVTVRFSVIGEDENYRDTAQYWAVKMGLRWKVFFSYDNYIFEFVDDVLDESGFW